MIELYNYF